MKPPRWLRATPLALALIASQAPSPALAQAPAEPAQEASGRPLDGYFLMGILSGLALFIVAKSARR